MGKVVIIMGSQSDLQWSRRIAEALDGFGFESALRVIATDYDSRNRNNLTLLKRYTF